MKPLALFVLALMSIGQDAGTMSGHSREISSLAISSNGKMLATGSVDMTVRLWDPIAKEHVAGLQGHGGEVGAVAFSPDGKLLASGEMYKKVKIWDVATQKEIATYDDIEGAVTGIAFTSDGKRVVASTKNNEALIWTIGSPAPAKHLKHSYAVMGVATSPDGKAIATIDDGGNIGLWNAATLNFRKALPHAPQARSIAFSADGKKMVSAGGTVVKVWDAATGDELASAKAEANSAAISADGSIVFVGTQDNLVMCMEGKDLSLKWKAEKHERPVTAVAISPDGKLGYSASMDRLIKIWKL